LADGVLTVVKELSHLSIEARFRAVTQGELEVYLASTTTDPLALAAVSKSLYLIGYMIVIRIEKMMRDVRYRAGHPFKRLLQSFIDETFAPKFQRPTQEDLGPEMWTWAQHMRIIEKFNGLTFGLVSFAFLRVEGRVPRVLAVLRGSDNC
jgi:hypothetical protein